MQQIAAAILICTISVVAGIGAFVAYLQSDDKED